MNYCLFLNHKPFYIFHNTIVKINLDNMLSNLVLLMNKKYFEITTVLNIHTQISRKITKKVIQFS